MNCILFPHRFKAVTVIRQLSNCQISCFQKRPQSRKSAIRQLVVSQELQRIELLKFFHSFEAPVSKFLQLNEAGDNTSVGVRHPAVEQIKRTLRSAIVQDSPHIFYVVVKIVESKDRSSLFEANKVREHTDLPSGQGFSLCLQFVQRRIQKTLDAEPISSQLKRHKFSMTKLASLVGDAHLANGQPRRNNRRAATYESLKIIYEVSPAVAVLTSDAARQTENHRQNDCRSNCNENQGEQTSLVKFRHRFPLRPATRQNRSHFFQSMESNPVRFAG